MKKTNIIFVIMITLFIFNTNTKALTYAGCDYSTISRLKSLVNNINIYYDYKIIDNEAYFDVTILNIPKGIYFEDTSTNIIYNSDAAYNGVIQIKNYTVPSGSYKFYSLNLNCYGLFLGNKYYSFPIYNRNYTSDLCKENSSSDLCQKWVKVNYNYNKFEQMLKNHTSDVNKSDDLGVLYEKTWIDLVIDFYLKFYYFILIGIVAVCFLLIIILRKKDKIV